MAPPEQSLHKPQQVLGRVDVRVDNPRPSCRPRW